MSSESLALREQYANPQQQRDTATLGMWVFLATEVLFFGGLFATFAIYRMYYTHAFQEGARGMTLVIGSVNTAVLFTSSLTMNFAIEAIGRGKQTRAYWLLWLTAGIGLIFLSLKFTEYFIHYQEHKVPGIWYEADKPDGALVEMFYFYYFALTGLHVVHLTIGIGLLSTVAVRTMLGRFNAQYHTAIDIVGLYWHFVDVMWIFIYTIFYTQGFH